MEEKLDRIQGHIKYQYERIRKLENTIEQMQPLLEALDSIVKDLLHEKIPEIETSTGAHYLKLEQLAQRIEQERRLSIQGFDVLTQRLDVLEKVNQ